MRIALGSQMREMDRITIEEYGIPGVVLMENASWAVADKCAKRLKSCGGNKAVFVCGTGNNGGDGFAAARILKIRGFECVIFLAGNPEKIKGDALINYNAAVNMEIPIINDISQAEKLLSETDLIVDAIFGTGFSGEPRKASAQVIDKINNSGKYVISVDIASGVDSETGHASDICVQADETVSFCMAKLGNILYPGAEKCGRLNVADISIPYQVRESVGINISSLDFEEAKALLPVRHPRSNKGTYGKLFVIAGSHTMAGAAYLSSKSAYRTGCGLVYTCIPAECLNTMQTILPEAVAKPVESVDQEIEKPLS